MSFFTCGFSDLVKQHIVGRDEELKILEEALVGNQSQIINFYGDAGMGKTTLINVVLNTAVNKYERKPIFFDCRENKHINIQKVLEVSQNNESMLVIDTFEHSSEILKNQILFKLIPQIYDKTPVVIAGRTPLKIEDPKFKLKSIRLKPLSYNDVVMFFTIQGIPSNLSQMAHQLSGGNPFLLNVFVWAITLGGKQVIKNWIEKGEMDRRFIHMVLKEVKKTELLEVLESASVVHSFDYEILDYINDGKLTPGLFNDIIGLSFITRALNHWHIHELVNRSIRNTLKQESPQRFYKYKKRAFEYYTEKAKKVDKAAAYRLLLDRIYLCENEIARDAMFFDPFSYYVEDEFAVTDVKPEEMKQLTEIWIKSCEQSYEDISKDQILLALDDTLELQRVCKDFFRVIKDGEGNIKGYHVVSPVYKKTIPYFINSPSYKQYFEKLPKHELEYLSNAARDFTDTYVIRHFVVADYHNISVRSMMFRDVVKIVGPGRRILTSTPNEFFTKVVEGLGFQIIPGVYDKSFGSDVPVAVLDFRTLDVDLWLRWLTLKDDVYPWLTSLIKHPNAYWRKKIKEVLENINNYKLVGENPLASLAVALTCGVQTLVNSKTSEEIGVMFSDLIKSTICEMETTSDTKWMGELLRVTYLENISSREQAAEKLNLSPSSYYRWLKKSIDYITDLVYQRARSVFKH